MRIMYNEQAGNPQGTQAVAESLFNRTSMHGTPLAREARWTSENGYYENGHGVSGNGYLSVRNTLEQSLNNALSGSNISNFATDNASGPTASGELRSGKFRYQSAYTGETFFSLNLGGRYGSGWVPQYRAWTQRMTTPTSATAGPQAMAASNTQLAMRGDTMSDAPMQMAMGKGDLGTTTRTPDDLRTIISEPRAATPPGQPAGPTMEGAGFPPSRKPYSPPKRSTTRPQTGAARAARPNSSRPRKRPRQGAQAATPRGDAGPRRAGGKHPGSGQAPKPKLRREENKPKGMKPG